MVCLVYLVRLVCLVCLVGPCNQLYTISRQLFAISSRPKMNAHGEFPINWLVAFQLGLEGPFIQRSHAGDGEFPMLGRFQHHDGHRRTLGDQHAHFHPIIEFFAVQSRGNGRPGCGFGNRSKLLILVERQAMDMDLGQLQHIFPVVVLMRGLVAGHRECYGRPKTDTESNPKSRTSARARHFVENRVHVGILYQKNHCARKKYDLGVPACAIPRPMLPSPVL